MSLLLFQLGRIDGRMLDEHLFCYEGRDCRTSLSSLAIAELWEEPVRVRLLFPISLPFNPGFAAVPPDARYTHFAEVIRAAWRDPTCYCQAPNRVFDEHPHVRAITRQSLAPPNGPYAVLPSFGSYPNPGGGDVIAFDALPAFIELSMLTDMLATYLEVARQEPVTLLAIDASCGMNVLVGLLWSAFRYLGACMGLWHAAGTRQPELAVFTVEPVLPGTSGRYQIHRVPIKPAAFFEYPSLARPHTDSDPEAPVIPAASKVYRTDQEAQRRLRTLLASGAYAWAATQFGIPLYLALTARDEASKQVVEAEIRQVCRLVADAARHHFTCPPGQNDWDNARVGAVRDAILALCLYGGLLEALQRAAELLECVTINGVEAVELTSLGKFYRHVSRRVTTGAAELFVRRELAKVKSKASGKKGKSSNRWEPVGQKVHDRVHPRNFLAHCGMVSDVARYRVQNHTIYVAYRLDKGRKGHLETRRLLYEGVFCRAPAGRVARPSRSDSAQRRHGEPSVANEKRHKRRNYAQVDVRVVPDQAWSGVRQALVDTLRERGHFGACLYWAEVLGVPHGLNQKQEQLGRQPPPPESPEWQPSYELVRTIQELNALLRSGVDPVMPEWLTRQRLRGRVKSPAQSTGVWIEVPPLADFFAPLQQLPAAPRHLFGRDVLFGIMIVWHPMGVPLLNAANVQLAPE